MATKEIVFFAYCWDNDSEMPFLKHLKRKIEDKSNNRISVIIDKLDFKVSEDYMEREKDILKSDCVVVFFTPEYKKIITEMQKQRGTYREYEYIQALINQKSNDNVFPVLFKGDVTNSIPNEFSKMSYFDLSKCSYIIRGESSVHINIESRASITNFIASVIKRTDDNFEVKEFQFNDDDDKYDILLHNTEADDTLPPRCMIKIDAYRKILKQQVYFVVGRKGSGKTTLFESIKRLEPKKFRKKYKTLLPIKAEHINIESIFHFIFSNKGDLSELPIDIWTDLFWQVFLLLQGIYVICVEEETFQIEATDPRRPVFKKVSNLLKRKLGGIRVLNTESARQSMCQLCLDTIIDFWTSEIYKKMNVDTIVASARAKLNPDSILEYFFGRALYNSYIRAIEQCERKILISLDGFDIKSENFSLNTQYNFANNDEVKTMRSQFEPLFYRSLIEVVKSFKKIYLKNNIDSINAITDYCIILPKDRMDQIQEITRDFAKFPHCNLSWDAYDLLMMLVLRLEEYFDIKPNKILTLDQRFSSILDSHLPKIPKQITMHIDGQVVSFELFNYILRLTLWRPREVIKLFAKILNLSDNCKDSKVNNEILRKILGKKGKENIINEFIYEYRYTFNNLSQVLHRLDHSDIIIPFGEFCEKLANERFVTSFAYDMRKIENRLKVLYHLGVFGLLYDQKVAEEKGLGHHICFVFNEGTEPLDTILESQNIMETRAKIIINPALQKYLDLHYNTTELIGNYSWEYIEENHMRRDTITRV